MTAARRLGTLVIGGAVALACVVSPRVAARADAANQECTNNNDITIVIDFQELGGGVNVRCAPQPVGNGFDTFSRANIAVDQYNGFVCRIAGLPEAGPCDRYAPANAYWVYRVARRDRTWCASNYGAGPRTPPPGTIDGWSYFLKSKSRPKPTPPRYPVPSAIPGTTPHPLNEGDCDGYYVATTTSAPSSVTTDAPVVTTTPAARATTTTTRAAGSVAASSTTLLDLGAPSSSTTAEATTTSSVPFGNVDLSMSQNKDSGVPWNFIAGGAVVAGLGGLAVLTELRRRNRLG